MKRALRLVISRLFRVAARLLNLLLPGKVLGLLRQEFTFGKELDYPYDRLLLVIESPLTADRCRSCAKEPETVDWLREHIKPGDVFYDIGANIGAYSLIAGILVGPNGRVVAFEPSGENFNLLCRNIARNRMTGRIHASSIALDGRQRLATFSYATLEPGGAGNSIEPGDVRCADPLQHVLATVTLDDAVFQFGLPCPSHIKIDVDGQEAAILTGGGRVLRDLRVRSVQVEVESGRQGSQDINALLEAAGFRPDRCTKHAGQQGVENRLYVRKAS